MKALVPVILLAASGAAAQSLPSTQPTSAPASAPESQPASQPASQPTPAPRPQPEAGPGVQLSGFVDVFAAFNPNFPADQANFLPGTGTAAKRANELGLNLAALTLSRAPAPVGFVLGLGVGQATEIVHAGEPGGVATGLDVLRLVQQASVQVKAGDALTLEAGIFPSHIGFEVFYTKDNWNYSRPWIGELSPYYSAGVKASYSFTPHLSGQLHLLNGWQVTGDNNQGKSVGTQLAYSGERIAASLNTFLGPELPGDNRSLRGLFDVVVLASLGDKTQLALSGDAAFQQRPGEEAAPWYAAAAWLRVTPREALAVALRAEVFHDPAGAISGTSQTLAGGTATLALRPRPSLLLKLEGRYDASTAATFSGPNTDAAGAVIGVPSQALALLGAVVSF